LISATAQDKAVRPYALEVGKLIFEWNKLQEYLGLIFMMTLKQHSATALAVWHSTDNDRTQRKMLRAAAGKAFGQDSLAPEKALEDIIWLVNKADDLANARNNAIHSPIMLIASEFPSLTIGSFWFYGNPRAANLKGKELLTEFKWGWKTARTLAIFALGIYQALSHGATWPKRPLLPQKVPLTSDKPRRHRTVAK
jgi:hypothetical protein